MLFFIIDVVTSAAFFPHTPGRLAVNQGVGAVTR